MGPIHLGSNTLRGPNAVAKCKLPTMHLRTGGESKDRQLEILNHHWPEVPADKK